MAEPWKDGNGGAKAWKENQKSWLRPQAGQLTWASLYLSHRSNKSREESKLCYSGCVSLGKRVGLEPIPTVGAMKVILFQYLCDEAKDLCTVELGVGER
jgi:hypothetical protein